MGLEEEDQDESSGAPLQVIIGREVEPSDPVRGVLAHCEQSSEGARLSSVEECLADLRGELEELRQLLVLATSEQRTSIEQNLWERLVTEIGKEREAWSACARRLWAEYQASELSGQRQQLQNCMESHLETRLSSELPKMLAEITTQADNHLITRLDEIRGSSLKQLVVGELALSMAQARENLQQQMTSHLAVELKSGITKLQLHMRDEHAKLRDILHADLLREIKKLQETVESAKVGGGLCEAQLTEQLVNWQPGNFRALSPEQMLAAAGSDPYCLVMKSENAFNATPGTSANGVPCEAHDGKHGHLEQVVSSPTSDYSDLQGLRIPDATDANGRVAGADDSKAAVVQVLHAEWPGMAAAETTSGEVERLKLELSTLKSELAKRSRPQAAEPMSPSGTSSRSTETDISASGGGEGSGVAASHGPRTVW